MKTVAVVGGGIAGTTISRLLAECFQSSVKVTLFDQGQRGFGGRTSHRRVDVATNKVLANIDDVPLEGQVRMIDAFDHGCQFFFASSLHFRQGAVADWLAAGVVRDWEERRVLWCGSDGTTRGATCGGDFFGISSIRGDPCYVGVGGMHSIAAFQASKAEQSGATLLSGTRVTGTARGGGGGGQWEIFGQSGQAAFHNAPEAEKRAAAPPSSLGTFDAVVFTDASCSYASWHRASAGAADIVPAMASWIAARPRIPLFAAMLSVPVDSAFAEADCVVFESGPLWYACKNSSKLGRQGVGSRECWTLISTPEFACQEIAAVPMCDIGADGKPQTFRPQEDDYLNGQGGPAEALSEAFFKSLPSDKPRPLVLYLQGQRWGSAIPGSLSGANTVEIAGTLYQRNIPPLSPGVVPGAVAVAAAGAQAQAQVQAQAGNGMFLFDDEQRVFYAGDFVCSSRVPGVEAAVLSAEDCARHVGALLSGGGPKAKEGGREGEGRGGDGMKGVSC